MDKNFDKYLAMLESAAPASKKADYHAARELYAKKARLESDSIGLNNASSWGKTSTSTFGGSHFGSPGAIRDPEQVKADNARADKLFAADQGFDSAAGTVINVAQQDPGKVDAWVDYRLKPAILRAKETGNVGTTPEEFKQAAKETYEEWAEKFKTEDREKKETEDRMRQDAFDRADEIERQKREGDLLANAQKKRDALGSNRDRMWDPAMSVGASDMDINHTISGRKSDDMAKNDAIHDEQKRMASLADHEKDTGYESGNPMSPEQVAENKAESDRLANLADTFDFSRFESVATNKLRAAFESVFGSSRGMSDAEIRTICESCYRRSKKR